MHSVYPRYNNVTANSFLVVGGGGTGVMYAAEQLSEAHLFVYCVALFRERC